MKVTLCQKQSLERHLTCIARESVSAVFPGGDLRGDWYALIKSELGAYRILHAYRYQAPTLEYKNRLKRWAVIVPIKE